MRNLMKLLAVVAVVAMMAGVAFANTIEMMKGDRAPFKPQSDTTRGLLDCSAVTELTNPYYNFHFIPSVGNVDDWGHGYFIHTGGEVVFHYTFPASTYGWDWAFSWVAPAGGWVDWIGSTLGCGEEFTQYFSWGAEGGSTISGTGGWDGEIWMVLDGEYGFGDFYMEISFSASLYVPFDFCADVLDVSGSGLFYGDTCDGYNTPSGSCILIPPSDVQYYALAPEDYYGVFMPAGSTFTAHMTSDVCDASMRVLDNCLEPVNCVGYMDYYWSGNPPEFEETLPFTNDTGFDALFYLVIDAYQGPTDPECCGTYELDFTSTGGAIANEEMSMGAVKALWR
ncbi:hypothetical protein KKG45_14205 [bacterium]|nr:hypothetical protein [bacterium]MBU1074390.1 hypothetical protein [bacterium]MBU1675806.1 hypothetical protein [bacterium]